MDPDLLTGSGSKLNVSGSTSLVRTEFGDDEEKEWTGRVLKMTGDVLAHWGDVVAHWQRARLLGQRSQVRIWHLPQ